MEYLIGVAILFALMAMIVSFAMLMRSIACKDCPLKEKCEKSVKDRNITLCEEHRNIYNNFTQHNNFIL